jgi:hypothetical protein
VGYVQTRPTSGYLGYWDRTNLRVPPGQAFALGLRGYSLRCVTGPTLPTFGRGFPLSAMGDRKVFLDRKTVCASDLKSVVADLVSNRQTLCEEIEGGYVWQPFAKASRMTFRLRAMRPKSGKQNSVCPSSS